MTVLTLVALCLAFLAGASVASVGYHIRILAERRRELQHLRAQRAHLERAHAEHEARMQEWRTARKQGRQP
jgi:hypothetical protein